MHRQRARQKAILIAHAQKEGMMSSDAPNDPPPVVSNQQRSSTNGHSVVKATVYLKKEVLKKAKHIALENDTTLSELTQCALEAYIDQEGHLSKAKKTGR